MKKKSSRGEAPFAYEGLDRVIHERARLSVLTSLLTHPAGLSFVELKQLCALTDGNLARHLQVLEEDKMVAITKEALHAADGLRPKGGRSSRNKEERGRAQTTVRITAAGRSRYMEYLTTLEQVVRHAASVVEASEDGRLSPKLSPLNA